MVEGGLDISDVSPIVASIKRLDDIMLFVPADCREAVENAIQEAIAGE